MFYYVCNFGVVGLPIIRLLDHISLSGYIFYFTHRGSILLVGVGDEGVPLASVVGVHHLAVLLESLLQLGVRHGLVDSVDEELGKEGETLLAHGRQNIVCYTNKDNFLLLATNLLM